MLFYTHTNSPKRTTKLLQTFRKPSEKRSLGNSFPMLARVWRLCAFNWPPTNNFAVLCEGPLFRLAQGTPKEQPPSCLVGPLYWPVPIASLPPRLKYPGSLSNHRLASGLIPLLGECTARGLQQRDDIAIPEVVQILSGPKAGNSGGTVLSTPGVGWALAKGSCY